jgi:hypothetical protein
MPLADLPFWNTFFLLLIWVPLVCLWIAALIDIFGRHDLNGGTKAAWAILVLVLPFFGVLLYMIIRPRILPRGA